MVDIYNSINWFLQTDEYKQFLEKYKNHFFSELNIKCKDIKAEEIWNITFLKNPKNISAMSPNYLVQVEYTWWLEADKVKEILSNIPNNFENWIKGISKFIVTKKEYEKISSEYIETIKDTKTYNDVYSQDKIKELLSKEDNEYLKEELNKILVWDTKIKLSDTWDYFFEKKLFTTYEKIPQDEKEKILNEISSQSQNEELDQVSNFLENSFYVKDIISLETFESIKKQISSFFEISSTSFTQYNILKEQDKIIGILNLKENSMFLDPTFKELSKVKKLLSKNKFNIEINQEVLEEKFNEEPSYEKFYTFLSSEMNHKKEEIQKYMPEWLPNMFRWHILGSVLHPDLNFPILYTYKIDYDYKIHKTDIFQNYKQKLDDLIKENNFDEAKKIFNNYLDDCMNNKDIKQEIVTKPIEVITEKEIMGWRVQWFIDSWKWYIHFNDKIQWVKTLDEAKEKITEKYKHIWPIQNIEESNSFTQEDLDNRNEDEVFMDKMMVWIDEMNENMQKTKEELEKINNVDDLNNYFNSLEDYLKNTYSIIQLKKELEEKLSQNTSEKLKEINYQSTMYFQYGNDKRDDIKSTSTFDAIINWERTSSTYGDDFNKKRAWVSQAKKWDIVRFWNSNKIWDWKYVDVELIEDPKKIELYNMNDVELEDWSKNEWWSVLSAKNKWSKEFSNPTWNIRFKKITAEDELTIKDVTDIFNIEDKKEIKKDIGLESKISNIKLDLPLRSEKWFHQINENLEDGENLDVINSNVKNYMKKLRELCNEAKIDFAEFNSYISKDFLVLYKKTFN